MRSLLIIKVLFLVNFLSAESAPHHCPIKCVCENKSVRCLNQGLIAVPKVHNDVRTLDVRFNKIFDIAPGIFSYLHHLRSLLLNDNQLTELRSGVFYGLKRIVYLYLYRNRIKHIDPDVFEGMIHLEQLYLHVNEIHEISPETFRNLPRLDRLYLQNNQLKTIPAGSFEGMPKLQKLRLDSNALVCDCSMLWLVQMLSEHTDMEVAAYCFTPPSMTGTDLTSKSKDDFHCREPEIMSDPQDTFVQFGDNAIFSCAVSGEPVPEIVWLHDSNEIPLDSHRYEVMGNGSLMVHAAEESDSGYYECMAKNPVGHVKSKPAKIVLINKVNDDHPLFLLTPSDQIVRVEDPFAYFDCKAIGNPLPHISWYFNGERILLSDRITLKHNGTVVIENIKEADAGKYTCQVENINGKINASANLRVKMVPAFTIVPSDQSAVIGDKVIFYCKARGAPTPTYTWFRNTLQLSESGNVIFSDNNEVLTILEATLDDEGIYHCRAENTEGLAEIPANLKIIEAPIIKPHITLKPESVEAFRETTVQLSCEVESEPLAELEWRKDGSRIENHDRITITYIGNLIINNLTLADTGSYECTAYNEYGRDTASAFLTVKDHLLPSDEYVNVALVEATRDIDQAIERTIARLFHNNTKENAVHDLFRISRYPNAPARDIARAAEIYERALFKVKSFIQAGLKANSTAPFDYQHLLSPKHLEIVARLSGCTAHREEKDCSDMCYHEKYRSIDGSCNNFAHPMWGSSLTGFRRILLPIYENGFSEPVGWNKDMKYNGFHLPSARLTSTEIISTVDISKDSKITHMAMQWGQWLDHDLDHALPSVSSQTWDGVDCKKTCDYAAPCFPINVPQNDPRVNNRRCIDFIRTSSVCGSGMTSVLFGKLQAREQINQLTSYIDASQVYGFDKTVAEDLRDLTNDNGLLRVGATFPGKKPLLPTIGLNAMDCRINKDIDTSNRNCFVSGDIRANEQIGLAAMHTIFMREHNRVAHSLKSLNPVWSGDKIYQESRKIVGAEMQIITYEHWLPIILGPEGYKRLGEYKGYNKNLNPSISNVFATAALRFGHSMINPILHRYDENFEPIPQGHLMLRHAFFAPYRLVDEGGVDPLFRGMFMTPAKLKTSSQNLNSELTERLFETSHAVALDLAAINIQRGRDHAIPPYTKWREFCNMTDIDTFDDLADEISDKNIRDKLEKLYGTPHNIDVWVGGILEDQVEGGKVGPLFRCLLIEQFQRLRDGDRFWYENTSVFTPNQLNQIKQITLARILCDNGDNIDTISENVFYLPEVQDGLVACDDLPTIDFRFWKDCESCSDEIEGRFKRQIIQNTNEIDDRNVRLTHLEKSQNHLENNIDQLRDRIKSLEEVCKK